ncbi:hypothetical protein PG913_00330 [Tenacibaculum pacificus]|uniref:hypothetical protein n=1 Tax=Tenacibaculum pacificus TaxID=3018314 RepID=UPI0022F3BDC9|nr:hypothetical protein [Tenacibaculum pacificus]WBX73750.1 hypothetical protein PG913_00330 [Tenacibaculum pacificus]
MNYNEIDLKSYNFDNDFIAYIESYQDIYKYKVLQNTSDAKEIRKTITSEKKPIKTILEDFFSLQDIIMC